jgi:AcrR family transcriptional regulator
MANPAPLDQRLVTIALDLLRDEGLEGLTLRRIARRAGVSHGAPLRHFRSLADLLSEVAAVGFRMLSEGVEKSGSQVSPDAGPHARLRAAGRAYVEIAVANPGLFALMFRPEDLDVEKFKATLDTLLAKYNPKLVTLYLHVFNLQTASGWATVTDALENDERLSLG